MKKSVYLLKEEKWLDLGRHTEDQLNSSNI